MLQAVKVMVKDPKTPDVKVVFHLEFTNKTSKSLDVTKHLKLEESYGQSVAEVMIGSLYSKEPSPLAKSVAKLRIGEILHLLLGEGGAQCVLSSLPYFLSMQVCSWKIKNYLTTINKDSDDILEQAHIYAHIPHEQPPLFCGPIDLTCHTLVIHIYPSHDKDHQAFKIEGLCTLNKKHEVKLNATLTPGVPKSVDLTFTEFFTARDVFGLLGVSTSFEFLLLPFQQLGIKTLEDKVSYEAGFALSQTLPSTAEVHLSFLFFNIECCYLCNLLPASLFSFSSDKNEIKMTMTALTTIRSPFSTSPEVCFEAQFLVSHKTCTKPLQLDCSFFIYPPDSEQHNHVYCLTVQPHYRPYNLKEEIQGASDCDTISALNTEIGRKLKSDLYRIPEVGLQIIDHMVLKKGTLHITDRSVQAVKLNVCIPHLKILSGRLQIHSGDITLVYSDKVLKLECSGKLTLLKKFTYNVEMILPTHNTKGKMSLENFSEEVL